MTPFRHPFRQHKRGGIDIIFGRDRIKSMAKKIKKNISLDDLGGMIKRSFDSVDKRFDSLDKRFDGVDARLENLEQGQEEIKLKLDQVAYRFEIQELDRRLKRIEVKLGLK